MFCILALASQRRSAPFARSRRPCVGSVPTLTAAPNAGFILSREAHGTEHGSTFVADLARENPVLRKQLVTLLVRQSHQITVAHPLMQPAQPK